jgi:DNA-binding CsgD family transcriptional regulator
MEHLYILYFFIALLFSICSVSISVLVYIKTKLKLVLYFLLFFTAFTLDLVFWLAHSYMQKNVADGGFSIFYYLSFVITTYLLFFSIVLFIHYFYTVSHAKLRNIIFAAVSLYLGISKHISLYLQEKSALYKVFTAITNFYYPLVILYILITIIIYHKRIKNESFKKLSFKVLIICSMFLPVIIAYDLIFGVMFSNEFFPLYPAVYCILCIIFLSYIVRKYLQFSDEYLPDELFYEKYSISGREKDVILLIVEGDSYKTITEKLFISLNTVKSHIKNIYTKLGINSRFELMHLVKENRSR